MNYRLMQTAADGGGAGGAGGTGAATAAAAATSAAATGTGGNNGAAGAGSGTGTAASGSAATWWSSVDFGSQKDAANTALAKYTSPTELLKAMQSDGLGQDWRKTIAGDDAKELEYLGRYSSVGDYHKATREMRTKLSSGEFARPLPADATEEQKTAWRAANGVPAKPEDYFAKLPDGLVIGADDKPVFDALAKEMLGHNVTPGQMHAMVKWYYGYQDQEAAAATTRDTNDRKGFETEMRQRWGQDYKANQNHLVAFLDTLGTGPKEAILNARLGDGMALFNHPGIVAFLTDAARKVHAPGTLGGSGAEVNAASAAEEIKKIETTMRTNRKEYNRDEAMQARYRQLLTWRDNQAKRAS